MASSHPVFVLVTGSAQSPSHYGYLLHLLHGQGYATITGLLPSVGTSEPVTVEDDTEYVRSRLILPILDIEKHDVILICHSYGGIPGSAAARGLGKAERAAQGKTTSVIGQIHIASLVIKGGDGKNALDTFGGQLPPHMRADEAENLLKCDDRKPPLLHDVSPVLADAAAVSMVSFSLTSFKSPVPAATWDAEAFKGRCAYIRTRNDKGIPYEAQGGLLQATGQEWITRDIESGHSPQLAAPEELTRIIVELAKIFEEK